jgi:tetratricopeptide (TPR) repeat protein/tRNA A-37 threonylcarbamoyl transferase component Bud32
MHDPTDNTVDAPSATEATLGSSTAPGREPPTAPGRESADVVPERGALIGRYVVLSKLGAGAMGVVLAAYDPELDRKVALKLLKNQRGPALGNARARLQREAQALAKLDHRNVVGVHDVGTHEGQLFVGMEYVEGRTLGEWIKSAKGGPRSWHEVVRVFAEAGRGLAAAHEAGLVHRDFKPDNVMLGKDGRVRVMDFGLARAAADDEGGADDKSRETSPDSASVVDRLTTGSNALSSDLTQTGSMLGTPAYMAPEQFGGKVDARSDQFSFCVALYEALHGERPFRGSSLQALVLSMIEGEVLPAPKNSTVPTWLRRVILRGLLPEPEKRWASMTELLAALADDPSVRRRKWWAIAGVVALLAGGTWGVVAALERDTQTCKGFEAKLEGVWDEARRTELESAFEQTGLPYAAATWERVQPWLDDYTTAWVIAREEACEATHRGEQSGELLDLRMACLDERLTHVKATVDVLANADQAVVDKAVQAVTSLPTLERCADIETLTANVRPPDDPEVAERVEQLGVRLAEARALQAAGKYAEGLELANTVVAEAQSLDYEPLMVRAWLAQGILQDKSGEFGEAETTLRRAYEHALGLKMLDEAASASTLLVFVVGSQLARYEDGRRWAEHAKPLARAIGTDEARADYLVHLGLVAYEEGKYPEARGHHEQALAIREKALGPDHPAVGSTHNNLGSDTFSEGKLDEARAHYERALAIHERALGPEHPSVAMAHNNLGNVALDEGKLDEARGHYERALAIREKALGPDHPFVASTHNNLGLVAEREGKLDAARSHHERALAINEKARGSEHPSVAMSLNSLGLVAEWQGKLDEARRYHERALAINEKALDPDHPALGDSHRHLGKLALSGEKFDEARGHYERALAIYEKVLGPDHIEVAYPLTGLGTALLSLGETSEALPHLERALTIRSSNTDDPTNLAQTRFALARALWNAPAEQGRDRDRARELAELARGAYVEAGEKSAVEEIDIWLGEH